MSSIRTFVAGADTIDGQTLAPRPSWTVGALLASDLVSLAIATVLAALVAPAAAVPTALWAPFRPEVLILALPLAYALAGLYPGIALGPIDEFRRLSRSTITFCIVSVSALALVTLSQPSWLLLATGALALATVPLGRAVTREWYAHRPWWGVPIVVLGAGETARLVIDRLRQTPRIGLKPVACLDDDTSKIGSRIYGVPVTGTLADVDLLFHRNVRRGLVAMPGVSPHDLVRLLGRHAEHFDSLILVPNLFGVTTVGVETHDLGGVLGLHVRHNLKNPASRLAKRALDVALVVPTVVLALPLVALAALAVMAVSPGSPFYFQERDGSGGRRIRVWKLRTMYLDAESRLERHLASDAKAHQEWLRHFKLANDPRILPIVGSLLRRTSLDELPQIVNVLLGEMSFVGPRPFPAYHLQAFSEEFNRLRATVRPGITGLWQVSARSDGDIAVQQELDTYYIRNWSLWMDLYVLVRTPLAVLSARGAR